MGTRVAAVGRWLARSMAAIAVAAGLAGCAGHAGLGTTSSACFHALPSAVGAVHGQGRLIGVRLEEVRHLHRLPAADRLGSGRVCLVAFRGQYASAAVSHPLNQASGPFAVVVVKPDGSRVLGTLVLARPPQRFQHL
ncbi:MAG TPA: hypothetical protein VE990_00030 [Acidimicrobiales bacterium]|nr:hypothetical protein [Acidimicrobiales bacterium]